MIAAPMVLCRSCCKSVKRTALSTLAHRWRWHGTGTHPEIICYSGLYHEIYNEPEKDQVLGDLVQWLDGQS